MRGGLRDESGVASPKRLPSSEGAHLRPPVFPAKLFRSVRGASTSRQGGLICAVGCGIGGGPAIAKSGCALGCVESCCSRSPDDARVATREDVGEVTPSAVGTRQDLAASKIVEECCEGIETEAHGVKGRE